MTSFICTFVLHHARAAVRALAMVVCTAGGLLGGTPARAQTTVTLSAAADNTMYSESATLSNGAGQYIFSGRTNENGTPVFRRALIRFDVAGQIPAGSTITEARLELYMSRSKNNVDTTSLHLVTAEWGEGKSDAPNEEGQGAPAAANDATWHYRLYNPGSPASSPAWNTEGGDYQATPAVTINIGAIGTYSFGSTPAMAADVQMWLDAPAINFGWEIVGEETDRASATRFNSRQHSDPTRRPRLVVTFIPLQPTGGCCFTDGSCTQSTQAACQAAGGVFQGLGVSCTPNPCPQPTGACCLPSGQCVTLTSGQCALQGGTYRGNGVPCTPGLCPIVLAPFVDALPIPAVAQPVTGTIGGVATYHIAARQFQQRMHRDLPDTTVWGYGTATPGPIIVASKGSPVTVRWINDLRDEFGQLRTTHYLPVDTCLHGPSMFGNAPVIVTHLHGGAVPPEADGYPEAYFYPGQHAEYVYPNDQDASTVWFHDHALGITRLNVQMGLAGLYVVRDPVEQALDLPRGAYDVPLAIQDRSFNPDGSLEYPEMWMPHFFGAYPIVNGKVLPYLSVARGKYRFRLLNGSSSREYTLGLSNGAPMVVIATEGGLLEAPVSVQSLTLTPGERAEVIVDFASYAAGTEIILSNTNVPGMGGAPAIPQIMKFIVGQQVGFTNPVPTTLGVVPRLNEADARRTRSFHLQQFPDPVCGGSRWLINGMEWHHITEFPRLNDIEVWSFINRTGVAHPMHMHLVRFQILDRQAFDIVGGQVVPTGTRLPPPPEEDGWKDTARADPGMITRVIARFEGYTGLCPYHCHILEHEDHEMMRQFRVVCPADLTTGAIAGQPGYGTPNGLVNNDDFFYYLSQFAAGNVGVADLTTGAIPGQPGYGVPNGVVNNEDFFYYLSLFGTPC